MTAQNTPSNDASATAVEGPRIIATFQPQAWINDDAVDSDAAITFDVTAQIIALTDEHGPQWVLDNVKDNSDISDDLWLDNPASADRQHNGPFIVIVESGILDYFDWRVANPTAAGRYENAVIEAAQATADAAAVTSEGTAADEDEEYNPFDEDGQYNDVHLYDSLEECQAAGAHLTNVNEDGYCNYCGHDNPHLMYEVTLTFGAEDDDQARKLVSALEYAMQTNDALPEYENAEFTTPRLRRTWPETDGERAAFADWQYLVANGDTLASFRDWYATRND